MAKTKEEEAKVKEVDEGGSSTVTIALIIELVVMAALIVIMTVTTGRLTRENALNHMATITDERAQIIENYVLNSEKTLRNFSKASQVRELLEIAQTVDMHNVVDKEAPGYDPDAYPEAKEALKKAQQYTIEFGNDVDNLEGVWIGTWETLVLTHTNGDGVVGMTTRKDPEKLKQLQDSMTNGDNGLYNAGIIISPATQKQILSMYIEVKNEKGDPIGLVGLGIFTEKLVDNLDKMTIKGIDDSFYSMVNTADNKYIFHTSKSLVTTEATIPKILEMTKNPPSAPGSFEYTDSKGKFISTYKYMDKYGWIMMLDAPRSEVYAMTNRMLIFVAIFGILIIGLILVFALLNKRQAEANRKLSRQIRKTEKTKESLTAAMFKDVLTNANNRVSFSMDLDGTTANDKKPYYFVMFNILDFSGINTAYGNDAGDAVLVHTADTLKECFPEGTVYRTGSDEFVVAVPAEDGSQDVQKKVMREARDAHGRLSAPMDANGNVITAAFKVGMAKKTGELNAAVITALKDLGNRQPGKTLIGQIQFTELR